MTMKQTLTLLTALLLAPLSTCIGFGWNGQLKLGLRRESHVHMDSSALGFFLCFATKRADCTNMPPEPQAGSRMRP